MDWKETYTDCAHQDLWVDWKSTYTDFVHQGLWASLCRVNHVAVFLGMFAARKQARRSIIIQFIEKESQFNHP